MQERPDYRAGRVERAVKVYTVCDESRFLIVRNVPALGCIDDLVKLFGLYGDIEEYRLLDEEECEPYTDVYWIKFVKYSNARFAKRKLDNYKILGNLLQVSYGPNCESLEDTKSKLEDRRRAVLNRIQVLTQGPGVRPREVERPTSELQDPLLGNSLGAEQYPPFPVEHLPWNSGVTLAKGIRKDHVATLGGFQERNAPCGGPRMSRGEYVDGANNLEVGQLGPVTQIDYSSSMDVIAESVDNTVQLVREKLDRISSVNVSPSAARQVISGGPVGQEGKGKRLQEENMPVTSKKRQDNRRRI